MTDDELKGLTRQQTMSGPQPGEIYRHYKGGLYSVVARAIREHDLTPLVIYRSNAHGTTWARTLVNFAGWVPFAADNPRGPCPRFSREKD